MKALLTVCTLSAFLIAGGATGNTGKLGSKTIPSVLTR